MIWNEVFISFYSSILQQAALPSQVLLFHNKGEKQSMFHICTVKFLMSGPTQKILEYVVAPRCCHIIYCAHH